MMLTFQQGLTSQEQLSCYNCLDFRWFWNTRYWSANSAGSAIDADGIDAAIAKTALAANTAVACNGALVGVKATVGAADAYISFRLRTAVFTAGAGKLVIEYITV